MYFSWQEEYPIQLSHPSCLTCVLFPIFKVTMNQTIIECREKFARLENAINLKDISAQLAEMDADISTPNFWDAPQQASKKLKERQRLSLIQNEMTGFKEQIGYYSELLEVCPEDVSSADLESLKEKISEFIFDQTMTGPNDNSPAILTINHGAGGDEAKEWTSMLQRMYIRFAVANGFEVEIEEFGNCFGTDDFAEGTSAFLEKRKADFSGE